MSIRHRFRALFSALRRDREADLVRDLRSHLDLEAEEQLDAGLPPLPHHGGAALCVIVDALAD